MLDAVASIIRFVHMDSGLDIAIFDQAIRHYGGFEIVDPTARTVAWLALQDGEYRPIERSGLVELGPAALDERIDWPPAIA